MFFDWAVLEFQRIVEGHQNCGQEDVNAPILKASSISAGIGRVTGWRGVGKRNLARSNCYQLHHGSTDKNTDISGQIT